MISICTVVDSIQSGCLKPFLNTVIGLSAGLVTNVYVGCIDDTGAGRRDCLETYSGITVNYFDVHIPPRTHWISYKHSIGLHKCMERVQTKYMMISDCDILFGCPGYDEFYVNLLETNRLRIAGIEMYKVAAWAGFVNAYGPFPSIHNCLVRTEELPGPEMFAGKLRYTDQWLINNHTSGELINENYYLVCGGIPEYMHLFPNPHACYDTGCNLLIWNQLTAGRWLSFVPGWKWIDFNRWLSNVPNEIVMPPHNAPHLLYHQGGLVDGHTNFFHMEYTSLSRKYPQIMEPR